MTQEIEKILLAGLQAPSGENCQPWEFEVHDNSIEIYNVPERDQSLYNIEQKGSLVAHGALLENISIAASNFGFETAISLFPDENQNHVATVVIQKNDASKTSLYKYIPLRSTNRKSYKTEPLAENAVNQLRTLALEAGTNLHWLQDPAKKQRVAEAASLNEQLIFQNKYLHTFFFNHIRWTEKENKEVSNGFFIDTLELKPEQRAMFKVLKFWNILKFLNIFGFSNVIAKENAKTYANSASFGLITLRDRSTQSYVAAGRTLERVWLTATSLGLSIQPLTGVLFFSERLHAGQNKEFSPEQTSKIQNAYSTITNCFELGEEIPAILFRIGESDPSSARAARFSLEKLTKK